MGFARSAAGVRNLASRSSSRGPIRLRRIRQVATLVAVMMTDPSHREGQTVFVAALGHQVEVSVSAVYRLGSAPKTGIGMENVAGLVFVEHTDSRRFLAREFRPLEVVIHLALSPFFLRKRHMVVVVEFVSERRNPLEAPAHALLERLDLGPGRP